jgi:uncharacterized protein YndB with AHSA1/START domain
MRVVKYIVIGIAVLAVLLIGIGYLLPSAYDVSRSVEIKAAPEKVYAFIADPREWKKWSVWNQRDPAMKIVYSGPPAGPGAKWAWESKSEGTGEMTFLKAEANRSLEYRLAFKDFATTSDGALLLQPVGPGTRVTWRMTGDVGNHPVRRYFAALMDRMVGPDFENGLANLKALAEKS